MASRLQCVAAIALVMQDKLMQRIPYGTPGLPNMQTILEIMAMSPEDATKLCNEHVYVSRELQRVCAQWPDGAIEEHDWPPVPKNGKRERNTMFFWRWLRGLFWKP
jgi:hypothetical protein